MRFRDSWFLGSGFLLLVLSASVLLSGVAADRYVSVRPDFRELGTMLAGFGLQLGAILMIAGVTMTLYRKARLRNPRLH